MTFNYKNIATTVYDYAESWYRFYHKRNCDFVMTPHKEIERQTFYAIDFEPMPENLEVYDNVEYHPDIKKNIESIISDTFLSGLINSVDDIPEHPDREGIEYFIFRSLIGIYCVDIVYRYCPFVFSKFNELIYSDLSVNYPYCNIYRQDHEEVILCEDEYFINRINLNASKPLKALLLLNIKPKKELVKKYKLQDDFEVFNHVATYSALGQYQNRFNTSEVAMKLIINPFSSEKRIEYVFKKMFLEYNCYAKIPMETLYLLTLCVGPKVSTMIVESKLRYSNYDVKDNKDVYEYYRQCFTNLFNLLLRMDIEELENVFELNDDEESNRLIGKEAKMLIGARTFIDNIENCVSLLFSINDSKLKLELLRNNHKEFFEKISKKTLSFEKLFLVFQSFEDNNYVLKRHDSGMVSLSLDSDSCFHEEVNTIYVDEQFLRDFIRYAYINYVDLYKKDKNDSNFNIKTHINDVIEIVNNITDIAKIQSDQKIINRCKLTFGIGENT